MELLKKNDFRPLHFFSLLSLVMFSLFWPAAIFRFRFKHLLFCQTTPPSNMVFDCKYCGNVYASEKRLENHFHAKKWILCSLMREEEEEAEEEAVAAAARGAARANDAEVEAPSPPPALDVDDWDYEPWDKEEFVPPHLDREESGSEIESGDEEEEAAGDENGEESEIESNGEEEEAGDENEPLIAPLPGEDSLNRKKIRIEFEGGVWCEGIVHCHLSKNIYKVLFDDGEMQELPKSTVLKGVRNYEKFVKDRNSKKTAARVDLTGAKIRMDFKASGWTKSNPVVEWHHGVVTERLLAAEPGKQDVYNVKFEDNEEHVLPEDKVLEGTTNYQTYIEELKKKTAPLAETPGNNLEDNNTNQLNPAEPPPDVQQQPASEVGPPAVNGMDDADENLLVDPPETIGDVMNILMQHREENGARINGAPTGGLLPGDQAAAQLLTLLNDYNAPLEMFSKITAWAEESAKDKLFENGKIPSRKAIIKTLCSRYTLDSLKPQVVNVTLRNSRAVVPVVKFSFTAALASLLTDPELMNGGCFAFPDPADPFAPPAEWPDDNNEQVKQRRIGDIVDGKWYSQTYHARCEVGGKDILCPIVIFLDKTHTDAKGRLTQEPVMFTLALFNQETRNNRNAWRPLGLLPNFKNHVESKDVDERNEDFHQVLGVILEDLKRVQSTAGLPVRFPYRDASGNWIDMEAIFKVPTAAVLGDHEGQNKNCGHRGCMANQPCRRCDIHTSKMDLPIEGRPRSAKKIEELCASATKNEIHDAVSHYQLPTGTGWKGMDCGVDGGRGMNLISWADVLHTLKHGLMDRLRDNLLKEWIPAFTELLKNHMSSSKSGRAPKDSATAKFVFKKPIISLVDLAAKELGHLLMHQSDRSLGRINYQSGIASGETTKFTGAEMPCVLLLFSIILSSGIGEQFFSAPRNTTKETFEQAGKTPLANGGKRQLMAKRQTASYIWAMEECIMLCELLTSDTMTVGFVTDLLAPYIRKMMAEWTNRLERYQGDGWRLVKFHNLIHFPESLLMMGTAKTTDTETGENLHLGIKGNAQNTQRQRKTFDGQVGSRFFESLIARRAKQEVGGGKRKTSPARDPAESNATAGKQRVSCPRFVIRSNGRIITRPEDDGEGKVKTDKEWHDKALKECLEPFLFMAVCSEMDGERSDRLPYYTSAEIFLGGSSSPPTLFRADPAFHSLKGTGRGWHDLAIARNPASLEPSLVAVQLLGFLRFDSLLETFKLDKRYNCREPSVTRHSEWAIVHAFTRKPTIPHHPEGRGLTPGRLHPDSRLLSACRKKCTGGTPEVFLVALDDITETCIGVPNLCAIETVAGRDSDYCVKHKDNHEYVFVQPRSMWADLYKDWIIKEMDSEEPPTQTQLHADMITATLPLEGWSRKRKGDKNGSDVAAKKRGKSGACK